MPQDTCFLTVCSPGKCPDAYGDPVAFYKIDRADIGQELLGLFRQQYEKPMTFGMKAESDLGIPDAVRFDEAVGKTRQAWNTAYLLSSVAGGHIQPSWPGGRTGILARLYDYAEKWERAARQRMVQQDGDGEGTATAAGSTWQDIQSRLLELSRQGEPYTTYRVLANRFKCVGATIKKAIDRCEELRAWRDRKPQGSPRAQSLNDLVTDNKPSDAPDPADVLMDDDVDKAMKILIAQVQPSERQKLVAMDKDQRREFVRLTEEQAQDLFNADYAQKGNRILGRKP